MGMSLCKSEQLSFKETKWKWQIEKTKFQQARYEVKLLQINWFVNIVLYPTCFTSQQDSIPDIHKDVCSNSTVLKTYVVCIKESDQEGKASR